MADDLKTAGKWALELGVPEKKLKNALKSAGLEPDAKKGACGYYSRRRSARRRRRSGSGRVAPRAGLGATSR